MKPSEHKSEESKDMMKARTRLGERLLKLREKAIRSGMKLLSEEEISEYIARLRR